MSSSFAKSSFGTKKSGWSPLKKIFMTAVTGLVLASGWADYQYYAPEATKDSVGSWVETKTHSEILGRAFGHKAPSATQGVGPSATVSGSVNVQLPPAPGK